MNQNQLTKIKKVLKDYFIREYEIESNHETLEEVQQLTTQSTIQIAYTCLGEDEEFDVNIYLDFKKNNLVTQLCVNEKIIGQTIDELEDFQELLEIIKYADFDSLISTGYDLLETHNENFVK